VDKASKKKNVMDELDEVTKMYIGLNPAKHRKIKCIALNERRQNCFYNGTNNFKLRAVHGYKTSLYFGLFGKLDEFLMCRSNVNTFNYQ